MEHHWIKTKQHIAISYEDRCIRLKNDLALYKYLRSDRHAADRLAAHIRRVYRKKFGKSLRITRRSLAVEIVWHVRVLQMMDLSVRVLHWGNTDFMKNLYLHMDVIDCGEKEIDGNRFIWDYLSRF